MIKTVIFDMDGVIVDTEPVHHYAYHEHFRKLGIEVPDDLYATFTGNSTKNVYQRLRDIFGIQTDTDTLIQTKRSLFNDAFDTKEDLTLLPGVESLIKDLHANGVQLILASSAAKVTIDRVFRRFGLYPYFSHILSGEDFEFSKPDPAIFVKAWELSGHERLECVVIEDSTNGIRAAKAAELPCIGYLSENSRLQSLDLADWIVSDFAQLSTAKIRKIAG